MKHEPLAKRNKKAALLLNFLHIEPDISNIHQVWLQRHLISNKSVSQLMKNLLVHFCVTNAKRHQSENQ